MSAPKVKADYERLAKIAAIFDQQATNSRQMLQQLLRQMGILQGGDWIGAGATKFYQEMNSAVLPSVRRLVAALEAGSRTTLQVSQIMRQAEEEAARVLRGNQTGPGSATGTQVGVQGGQGQGMAGAQPGAPGGSGAGGGTLPAWARGPIGILASILGNPLFEAGQLLIDVVSEAVSPDGLRGGIFNFLAKHIPQNSVIRKILNSRTFQHAMIGLNVISGIMEDLNDPNFNGDLSRVIGTNIIDTAVNEAITAIVPEVTLVNDAIQVGGTLGIAVNRQLISSISNDAAIQQMLGRDMDLRESALDRMDLGNVTKAYSGALFDGYRDLFRQTGQAFEAAWRDPSAGNLLRTANSVGGIVSSFGPAGPTQALLMTEGGRQGMFNTLRATGNLLDAAVDTSILTSSSMVRQGAALSSTIVDSLPVSDNFRTAYRNLTRRTIQEHQAATAEAVNLIDLQ